MVEPIATPVSLIPPIPTAYVPMFWIPVPTPGFPHQIPVSLLLVPPNALLSVVGFMSFWADPWPTEMGIIFGTHFMYFWSWIFKKQAFFRKRALKFSFYTEVNIRLSRMEVSFYKFLIWLGSFGWKMSICSRYCGDSGLIKGWLRAWSIEIRFSGSKLKHLLRKSRQVRLTFTLVGI
jgi:hypothetical protein